MGEKINAYKVFVEKLEGRRQLARPMLIREDIIETGLNEV
jgi:hypothetical protein